MMTDESEAVKAVFYAGAEAWNRGDMDGYLSIYADQGPVRWVSGNQMVLGKEAIAAGVKARFDSNQALGTLTIKNLNVEILTASDALVFGEYQLESEDTKHFGVFIVHLKKFATGWAIVSDHASALD